MTRASQRPHLSQVVLKLFDTMSAVHEPCGQFCHMVIKPTSAELSQNVAFWWGLLQKFRPLFPSTQRVESLDTVRLALTKFSENLKS